MCDVEKIEFEKAVNNSFSALKKSADNDGERTAAVKTAKLSRCRLTALSD